VRPVRKSIWIPAVLLIICVVTGLWWAHGGQGWLAVKTGTRCGSTGESYCYWSGFGSVMPWSLFVLAPLFSLVLLQWRHLNCHEIRCARIGRFPVAGGEFRYCGKHHPDWKGRRPSRAHVIERMNLYVGQKRGPG
jgi:hypothetical protein